MITLSFSGHRPDKLPNKELGYKIPNPYYLKIKDKIGDILKKEEPDLVICGMALGVDQWAAQACVDLGISFIAACPFKGFHSSWSRTSQLDFHRLCRKASKVYFLSQKNSKFAYQIRNEWMVDKSHKLVCFWNGSPGGTKNCLIYARRKDKLIIEINPDKLVQEP